MAQIGQFYELERVAKVAAGNPAGNQGVGDGTGIMRLRLLNHRPPPKRAVSGISYHPWVEPRPVDGRGAHPCASSRSGLSGPRGCARRKRQTEPAGRPVANDQRARATLTPEPKKPVLAGIGLLGCRLNPSQEGHHGRPYRRRDPVWVEVSRWHPARQRPVSPGCLYLGDPLQREATSPESFCHARSLPLGTVSA